MAERVKKLDEPPLKKRVYEDNNINVNGAVNSTVGTVTAVGVNNGEINIHHNSAMELAEITKDKIKLATEGKIPGHDARLLTEKLERGIPWVPFYPFDKRLVFNWPRLCLSEHDSYFAMRNFIDKDKKNVYIVETPEEFNQISKIRENRIIMLKDIFGTFTFDPSSVHKWIGVIKDLFDFQFKRKQNSTQVLFVCRKEILQEAKKHLGHYGQNMT